MNGKFLSILVSCLIWGSSGNPANVFLSYQDSLGQYSFGYSAPGSARSEVKTLDGTTRGAYSYVDVNGVIQTAEYVADDDGFHIIATNLPQAPLPVEETAEVSAARKEHLEALRLAERMAEEAENHQEPSVLLKESVDQSERSENENRESSKVVRMEEVSNMDNQVQTLPQNEPANEESLPELEAATMDGQTIEDDFMPTVNLLLNTPYMALIRFAPPCAIHYVPYK